MTIQPAAGESPQELENGNNGHRHLRPVQPDQHRQDYHSPAEAGNAGQGQADRSGYEQDRQLPDYYVFQGVSPLLPD